MVRLVWISLCLLPLAACGRSERPGSSGPNSAGTGAQGGGNGGMGSGGATTDPGVAAILDGYVMKLPCLESSGPRSCRTHPPGACPVDPDPIRAGARPTDETLSFGGRSGVRYEVTLRVQGIVESKAYRGGFDASEEVSNGFLRAATVDNSTNQRSVFAMRVVSPAGDYFWNSLGPTALVPSTFVVDYEATLTIQGGTPLEMRVTDPNCQALRNCLPSENASECVPAGIPALEPKVREGLGTEPNAYDGQFLGFAVKTVRELG